MGRQISLTHVSALRTGNRPKDFYEMLRKISAADGFQKWEWQCEEL